MEFGTTTALTFWLPTGECHSSIGKATGTQIKAEEDDP
jgi:hypothetical protein